MNCTLPYCLSAREIEVLRLIEFPDKEIAIKLSISEHTVHMHVRSIREKLNVCSRTAAAMKALREGIIS